jgi:recombination protein RecA
MKAITEQVLLGSMCGDGYIRHISRYPYYGESHSVQQKDYIVWKSEFLSELNPKIIETSQFHKKMRKVYKGVRLYTPINKELLKFRKLFYKEKTVGTKHISYRVLKMLKPLALAIWYMDDGNYGYGGNNITLASCMNVIEIQEIIKRYFKNVLGLNCCVDKAASGLHVIRFSVESSDKFLRLIQKYVPDCMKYKLGHLCVENSIKLKEFKVKRSSYVKSWSIKNKQRLTSKSITI